MEKKMTVAKICKTLESDLLARYVGDTSLLLDDLMEIGIGARRLEKVMDNIGLGVLADLCACLIAHKVMTQNCGNYGMNFLLEDRGVLSSKTTKETIICIVHKKKVLRMLCGSLDKYFAFNMMKSLLKTFAGDMPEDKGSFVSSDGDMHWIAFLGVIKAIGFGKDFLLGLLSTERIPSDDDHESIDSFKIIADRWFLKSNRNLLVHRRAIA